MGFDLRFAAGVVMSAIKYGKQGLCGLGLGDMRHTHTGSGQRCKYDRLFLLARADEPVNLSLIDAVRVKRQL